MSYSTKNGQYQPPPQPRPQPQQRLQISEINTHSFQGAGGVAVSGASDLKNDYIARQQQQQLLQQQQQQQQQQQLPQLPAYQPRQPSIGAGSNGGAYYPTGASLDASQLSSTVGAPSGVGISGLGSHYNHANLTNGVPRAAGPGSIVSGGGSMMKYKPVELDNKSTISSTPSRASKITYSEYPQIRPTNPLYTSQASIAGKTLAAQSGVSRVSRASTMNTVSRRQKYNPNAPRRISDWRWISALAVLLFFPTGVIALGLAFKARTKFEDGFIDEARKLNKRSMLFCIASFLIGVAWILTAFFIMDKWPRTNG